MDDICTDAKTLIRMHNRKVSDPSIAIHDLQIVRVARKVIEQAAKIEAAQSILWMAREYAEGGGSNGPEMQDYRAAAAVIGED